MLQMSNQVKVWCVIVSTYLLKAVFCCKHILVMHVWDASRHTPSLCHKAPPD